MVTSTAALHSALRAANADVTQRLQKVAKELSTGRRDNPARELAAPGLSLLVAARRSSEAADRHLEALSLAANRAAATTTSISAVREAIDDLPERMLSAGSLGGAEANFTAKEARLALNATVDYLNARSGGRHLFSGTATDVSPLSDASLIIDTAGQAYDTAIGGGASVQAAVAAALDAVRTGFGDGTLYRGSATGDVSITVNGNTIGYGARANEPALRDSIAALAVASALEGRAPSLQTAALHEAGAALLAERDGVIAIEARVGAAEATIGQARTVHQALFDQAAERLEDLAGVDPYAAATELEDLRVQLETIYSVTGRIAGMSLAGRL